MTLQAFSNGTYVQHNGNHAPCRAGPLAIAEFLVRN